MRHLARPTLLKVEAAGALRQQIGSAFRCPVDESGARPPGLGAEIASILVENISEMLRTTMKLVMLCYNISEMRTTMKLLKVTKVKSSMARCLLVENLLAKNGGGVNFNYLQ